MYIICIRKCLPWYLGGNWSNVEFVQRGAVFGDLDGWISMTNQKVIWFSQADAVYAKNISVIIYVNNIAIWQFKYLSQIPYIVMFMTYIGNLIVIFLTYCDIYIGMFIDLYNNMIWVAV